LQTHSSVGSSPKFFIALTIIGCNHLKSPLKRVITRPSTTTTTSHFNSSNDTFTVSVLMCWSGATQPSGLLVS
jgi:hypothetical protein